MEKDIYINLIIKELKGEISEDNRRLLSDWLENSQENKAFKEEVETSWRLSKKGRKELVIDSDKDYQKLKKRIDLASKVENGEAIVKPLKSNRRLFMWAAASVALLATCWFLFEGNSTTPRTALNTGVGESNSATLPDGSIVWLNEQSTLEFENAFNGDTRAVKMSGEVFFDVESNPAKPFTIEMESGRVQVLGTSFNVNNRTTEIEVQVEEGRVSLSNISEDKKIILTAGEFGRYSSSTNEIAKTSDYRKNRTSWKSNSLLFEETILSDVILDIEKHFETKVIIEKPSMRTCSYAGFFPNAKIETVLSVIARTFDMELSETANGEFTLKNGVCKK